MPCKLCSVRPCECPAKIVLHPGVCSLQGWMWLHAAATQPGAALVESCQL